MFEVDQEKDLPLMANAEEIRIRHYMLKLQFDLELEIVQGESHHGRQESHISPTNSWTKKGKYLQTDALLLEPESSHPPLYR